GRFTRMLRDLPPRLGFRTLRVSFTIEQQETRPSAPPPVGRACPHRKRKPSVTRFHLFTIGLLCAWTLGCNTSAGPVERAANSTGERAADDRGMAPQQEEPALDDEPQGPAQEASSSGEPADDVPGPQELQLDGITFVVPGSWKRVKPQTNIIEAEFE